MKQHPMMLPVSKPDVASAIFPKKGFIPKPIDVDIILDNTFWEDVTCPICLDFPHNGVLLRCSSYNQGCRPYICDTDHTQSNCLERFKSAYGLPPAARVTSTNSVAPLESIHITPSDPKNPPACPLCRGDVVGWVIADDARLHLNVKKRCCQENNCVFVGNYFDLQKHIQLKHPDSRPSEIDPVKRLDWENFQQSSDIIDVLTTIQTQVPNGIILGDYIIEYGGDDGSGDDYEVLHRVRRRWWFSCLFCKPCCLFSRNRRRTIQRERRRSGRTSHPSNSDDANYEGSTRSVDFREIRPEEINESDFVEAAASVESRTSASRPVRDRHAER